MRQTLLASFSLVVLAACATTQVSMDEPRRVVGTEDAVRVDAEINGDQISAGTPVLITYAITNNRTTPIAVADIVPETTFDRETATITIGIGSEVPGESLLPRLISIKPGEKKTFSTTARLGFVVPRVASADPDAPRPAALLRLKVNFLGDTAPFAELLDIPEKAVADSKRADELFPLWIERNEAVYTNTVPMHWTGFAATDTPVPARRRRG